MSVVPSLTRDTIVRGAYCRAFAFRFPRSYFSHTDHTSEPTDTFGESDDPYISLIPYGKGATRIETSL
jgi:hypothetical protein